MTSGRRETLEFDGLRVDGFKSFADPVTIPFEPGVTGIVGPVGCGKSNLVEALQWVMGETSVKKLRGEESEHLIFAGNGSGRNPRGHAEVALLISDPHNLAPRDMAESSALKIVRRIDRGRGTGYKVNGKPFRLKDLQVLFKDNATGPSSTGMINQGKVAALVTSRPAERRFVLDEAAGITGSLVRRREVEQRLASAKENLERADESTSSVSATVRTLRRQAAQATLLREVETALAGASETLARDDLARAASDEAAARHGFDDNEKAIAGAILSERKAVLDHEASIKAHEDAVAAASRSAIEEDRCLSQLREFERELQRAKSHASDLEKRITESTGDLSALERSLKEENERLTATVERLGQIQTTAAEALTTETSLTPLIEEARKALIEAEAKLATASEALAASEGRRRSQEAAVAAARLTLQRSEIRLADLAKAREKAAAAISAASSPASYDPAIEAAGAALITLSEQRDQAVAAGESARTTEAASAVSAADLGAALTAARSERSALSNNRSAARVRQDITPDAGFETALSAALGRGLYAPDDAGAPLRWGGPSSSAPRRPGIRTLADHVAAPASVSEALASVVVVAEKVFDDEAASLPFGFAVVDKSGQIAHWHGLRVKGADDEASLEMRRRNRIDALDKLIAEKEPLHKVATGRHAEAKTTRQDAERRIGDLGRLIAEADRNRANAVRSKAEAEAVSIRLNATFESAGKQEADAATQTKEAQETLLLAEKSLVTINTTTALEVDLSAARQALAVARDIEKDLSLRHTTAATARNSATSQAAALEREIEVARDRLLAGAPRLEALRGRLTSLQAQRADLPAIPTDDGALKEAAAVATAAKKHRDDALRGAQAKRSEQERSASNAAVALAKVMETRERLRESILVAAQKLEQAQAAVPDGNGHRIDDVDRQRILKERDVLQGRREKIGAVNLLAEEDLKEQEKRLGDMERARRETLSAIRDLNGSLEEIDAEARSKLLQAFQDVEGHFKDLASKIFGGGEAHLRMIGDDPLEAGLEVYVSPPGKSIQAISLLSGGERTMASLALVFAAFKANPAPICVLDEADAALEDWSADVFCDLVRSMAENDATRFLVVTHKPLTMARMDRLFGVTMTEPGVSRVARMDIDEAVRMLDDEA